MKKAYLGFLLIMGLCAVVVNPQTVHAQGVNPCGVSDGKAKYQYVGGLPIDDKLKKEKEKFGFDVELATKTAPPHPIVIGQDEEQRGADLSVMIRSFPGTITVQKFKGYEMECRDYPGIYDQGTCPKGHWLEDTDRPICQPWTQTVYRNIKVSSVKVWLNPSEKTQQWLGWTTEGIPGNLFPLRYVYPENWSLAFWTPGGFTTIGNESLFFGGIDPFAENHPGFDFVKSDPRELNIPSEALMRVYDPMGDTVKQDTAKTQGAAGAARRVLGLFGGFTLWENCANCMTSAAMCLVYAGKGWCSPAPDALAQGVTNLDLEFHGIPLDLPGEWSIGVMVQVNNAKYNDGYNPGLVDEKYTTEDLYREPGHGYNLKTAEHTFASYVIMSTLCDGTDPEACES